MDLDLKYFRWEKNVVFNNLIIAWEIYTWITIGNFLHMMKKNEGKTIYETTSLVKMYFWDGGNVCIDKFSCLYFYFPFIELKMHVTKIITNEI